MMRRSVAPLLALALALAGCENFSCPEPNPNRAVPSGIYDSVIGVDEVLISGRDVTLTKGDGTVRHYRLGDRFIEEPTSCERRSRGFGLRSYTTHSEGTRAVIEIRSRAGYEFDFVGQVRAVLIDYTRGFPASETGTHIESDVNADKTLLTLRIDTSGPRDRYIEATANWTLRSPDATTFEEQDLRMQATVHCEGTHCNAYGESDPCF